MNTSHTERFNDLMNRNKPAKKEKVKAIPMKMIEERENMSYFQRSLSKCLYSENTVFLPKERLENYMDIRKALIDAGATYKNNTFIFPNDAEPFINRLMGGEEINIKKTFQFFATPPKVAKMVIDKIQWFDGANVLEPSAGQGGLLNELPKEYSLIVECIELMPENAQILTKKGYKVTEADYLTTNNKKFDIIIANPPFSKNQDITHFMKMYEDLNEGGQMAVITSCHWNFAQDKKSVQFKQFLDDNSADYEEIEAGEFKSSGTAIKTMLVSLRK